MRRQRLLRAPSAQSLCVFCACRLGIESPIVTTQLQRRQISNTRALFQSSSAAPLSSTADNGTVESSSSNGGLPSWYDPNSGLSRSEQQEKENRRQLRAQSEFQKNQAAQEAMRREEEERNKRNAEQLARKRAEQSQARGKGSQWSMPRTNMSRKVVGLGDMKDQQAKASSLEQGISLGAAMLSKQGDRPRETRERTDNRARLVKSNGQGNAKSRNTGTLQIRKLMVGGNDPPQDRQGTEISENLSKGQQRPQQQQDQAPRLSNPFASRRQKDNSGTEQVTRGWGAQATETKPLEYSEAPSPTRRIGARESTGVAPPPNPNIEDRAISPRIRRPLGAHQPRDAVNAGSFGHFEEDYEPANPARPQAPQKQTRQNDALPERETKPTPALNMGSFGSHEADGQYQEEKFDRHAPSTEKQATRPSFLANLSQGTAVRLSTDSGEQQHSMSRGQSPSSSQNRSYDSDNQSLVQHQGNHRQSHRPEQPLQPPQKPAQSSSMTLGQQYGHLPGCPCNLCNPEPAPAKRDGDSALRPSEPRAPSRDNVDNNHGKAPTSQASRHNGRGSYQEPPATNERYSDTGYRAVPFDPNELQSTYSPTGADSSNDWQHLRRKNSGPPGPPADGPLPPQPQQQPYQQPRNDSFDDDWVDRTFQNHVREREKRQQAWQQQAQQQPSTQRHQPVESSDVHHSRTLFEESSFPTKKCGRCGEIGHIARHCSKPSQLKCLACGELGHKARDCPQRQTRRDHARSVFSRDSNPFGDRSGGQTSDRGHSFGQPDSRPRDPFDNPQSFGNGERQARDPWGQRRRSDADGLQSERFAGRTPAEDDRRGDRGRDAQSAHRAQWQEQESQTIEEAQPATKESKEKLARRSRWEDAEVEDAPGDKGRGRKAQRATRREFDEDEDDEEGARDAFRARKAKRQAVKEAKKEEDRRAAKRQREARKLENATPITLPEFTSIQHLSQLLGVRYEQFVERLDELGYDDIFPGKTLNSETASMIAMEYNFEPTFDAGIREGEERDLKPQPEAVNKDLLPIRPPVVTIMGHVDHGKTTILDYLRKSSVAAGEAGGITQHIGAFSVPLASSGRTITFLDTPGHAAFLAMRQRGANVTDIVILVVAADDSVKPQTLEAIKHAKAAGVPMIVAINKVDKEEADVQRVKQDLARHGVEIEDFGGETQVVEVSGKTGHGMDELEETVMTLSEILDHRAETYGAVEGWVLEATTKKAGRVATVLVRRGTLTTGTVIVAGKTWARVRTLKNEAGKNIDEIGPGMPVEVDGWRDQPMAGDEVLQAPTEQKANSVVDYRLEIDERQKTAVDTEAINEARRIAQERHAKEKAAAAAAKQAQRAAKVHGGAAASPEAEATSAQEDKHGQKTVPFIIKADVSGSVEAVSAYIMSVSNPLIAPVVLQSGVGGVHESDIELANAAGGHIIAFNLPTDAEMNSAAEARGVKVLENNIIYRVLDDVKAVLEEKLPPIISQRVLGEAEIGASFEIGIGGRRTMMIAGCKIRNGVVRLRARARVMREGKKVYDGTISSLKNVKKDVQEMRKGTECGMAFNDWGGFAVGDQIQTYEEISEKRKL